MINILGNLAKDSNIYIPPTNGTRLMFIISLVISIFGDVVLPIVLYFLLSGNKVKFYVEHMMLCNVGLIVLFLAGFSRLATAQDTIKQDYGYQFESYKHERKTMSTTFLVVGQQPVRDHSDQTYNSSRYLTPAVKHQDYASQLKNVDDTYTTQFQLADLKKKSLMNIVFPDNQVDDVDNGDTITLVLTYDRYTHKKKVRYGNYSIKIKDIK